ncbi:MAG: hypothetical protein KDC98_19285 [Planctomycetes bacterium]|nr:hypothetical protein [Planctomycetota bacterium]
MTRSLATLVACSAVYGFSIGVANSWLYSWRNVVKFPLLILTTALICALSYFVLARFLGTELRFVTVQRLVLAIFRDVSLLLASLTPVVLYLGQTMQRPVGRDLGDYPMFQGCNVFAIALCGCLAVHAQARRLGAERGIVGRRRLLLVGGWMLVSLLVGGQVCWYMRPFFGIGGPDSAPPPFFAGTRPDFQGARSFYEAVYNLVAPPDGWR